MIKVEIQMQSTYKILRNIFQRSLVVLSLVCLFGFGNPWLPQPSYAATSANPSSLTSQEKADESYTEAAGSREAGYEAAKQDAANLKTEEKAYERNLKAYKEEQPNPGLVEGAKDVIEKITGNS